MTLQGLRSNMWLLAYEADLKGWLAGAANFVAVDPYFKELQSRRVSFYDVKKNVVHIKKRKPKMPSAALKAFLKTFSAETWEGEFSI